MNNYFPYSDSWFQELKRRQADPTLDDYNIDANGNYVYYGSTNWLAEFYKRSNSANVHSLNFSGGNESSSYYLSGRAYEQDGIYKVGNEDFNKYNLRGKGSLKLKPWLTLDNNTSLNINNYLQPMPMRFYLVGGYGVSKDQSRPSVRDGECFLKTVKKAEVSWI